MTRAILALARALLELAHAIRDHGRMCCSEHGVFMETPDRSLWWRRHDWLSEKWQPVAQPPGATKRLPGKTPETGISTRRNTSYTRRSTR